VENTPAFYDTTTIIAVKSFMVQGRMLTFYGRNFLIFVIG